MWRWGSDLPRCSSANIVSLGEGDTPIVNLSATLGRELGLAGLFLKAEDRNPTGSFKARIASVAASLVVDRGLRGLVGTSSGNGGAAAAAYAAAAGVSAHLFMLTDTAPTKLREILAYGGHATRVEGVGHDAQTTRTIADRIAAHAAEHGFLPMLTAFAYSPLAMAGVKTIAYELAEQVPQATTVYVPVGGGGLITGIHRGYQDVSERTPGQIPALVGVQPAGSASLRIAMAGRTQGIDGPVTTHISGLQMATLFDPDDAVRAVRETGGHDVLVSDEEIRDVQRMLARQYGLFVEGAAATALAGVVSDSVGKKIPEGSSVVALVTGAGYKDDIALEKLADGPAHASISLDQVDQHLAALGSESS